MLLVVDNGSVYTPHLLDTIKELDVKFDCLIPYDLQSNNFDSYSSFILSGRRKNDSIMNVINSKLVRYALEKNKPLLGICYGAEILALTLGGTIKKMPSSRHGLYQVHIIRANPLCKEKIQVFESHSYLISKLDTSFTNLASSEECIFEIFRYSDKNIFGTQFHPEMSPDGKALLSKFISI